MGGSIDRYGILVQDPMDTTGVQLRNKPLLGVIAEGAGTTNLEISIDNGATWFALSPAVVITADVAVSSDVLAPLAAYCIKECRVRFLSGDYGVATAVTWICCG